MTSIPDGTYYLLPEGSAWTGVEFRNGKLISEWFAADAGTHHAARDQWAGAVPSEADETVEDRDLSEAIILRVLGENTDPEMVYVTREIDADEREIRAALKRPRK